jgi:hypothetical protein
MIASPPQDGFALANWPRLGQRPARRVTPAARHPISQRAHATIDQHDQGGNAVNDLTCRRTSAEIMVPVRI